MTFRERKGRAEQRGWEGRKEGKKNTHLHSKQQRLEKKKGTKGVASEQSGREQHSFESLLFFGTQSTTKKEGRKEERKEGRKEPNTQTQTNDKKNQ